MNDYKGPKQSRAMTYFKFFSEKYLWGSTRSELLPDERAVWVDFLCLASIGFGTIECFSRDQLAGQLLIDRELLDRTVEKCIKFGKIKKKYIKREKKEIFSVENWSHYQAPYLTKRLDKSCSYGDERRSEKTSNNDSKNSPILEERKGEDMKEDEIIGEERKPGEAESPISNNSNDSKLSKTSQSNSTKPINERKKIRKTDKEYFLGLLKDCDGYPFDEVKDGQVFDLCIENHRNVDPIMETEKKIEYWKKNPGALKSTGKSPRTQLFEFFEEESMYQKEEVK